MDTKSIKIFRVTVAFDGDGDFIYMPATEEIETADGVRNATTYEKAEKPIKFKYWGKKKPKGDLVPGTAYHFLFSDRVVQVLGETLRKNGLLFSAVLDGKPHHVFYCSNQADVLDLNESRFYTSGNTGRVRDTVFRRDAEFPDIFSIKERSEFVYVNERTKKLIEDADLTGFEFKKQKVTG